MGNVSRAVGCAVGIPCGVGVILALILWARLQRRFRKEEIKDKDLENEIYNEDSLININNINTWKVDYLETTNKTSNSVDSSEDSVSDEKKGVENIAMSSYVPAYRKNIQTFHLNGAKHYYKPIDSNPRELHNNDADSHPEHGRKLSVYDQMVPIISDKLYDSYSENTIIITHDNQSNISGQTKEGLIKNLYSQDFGSYYPRKSTTSLTAKTNTIFPSSNVSTTTIESTSVDPALVPSIISQLKAANNDNQASLIQEEDQYENEFTNYAENKREFIRNLTPKVD
ncbi:hypothetical protein KAFR_0D02130 [Kazachstania africana CBS 2517]|uniref:Suppressor of lethality of KEX2 GAS1 double null mutant protein 1 n=1 Tax=Kazachstania africana (strain ATCC 22294 / BCRC 22015 / CBS 2517 / CECT 1963 / NBRC 1671 / NRRL Y-8276) TaxID=1071382 RepID=H2AU10_KAZAF|nr:hypothetical protein KAFR_0D02130 [Kazachstania africana CBS 2517]CCF57860.1 hypothetical protein KAFR_0D02130 [Kazachstania africana CBS 2517]